MSSEKVSDCCNAKYDEDREICLECGEHSGFWMEESG